MKTGLRFKGSKVQRFRVEKAGTWNPLTKTLEP